MMSLSSLKQLISLTNDLTLIKLFDPFMIPSSTMHSLIHHHQQKTPRPIITTGLATKPNTILHDTLLQFYASIGASTHEHHLADGELVDQKKYLEEYCKPKCVKPLIEYEACVKRIEGDESGTKHCTGQYFDYFNCVDRCVAPKLFTKLK
ncbi:hypothetical protein ACFE04_014163 [Oxalis oulophora]